MLKTMQDNPNSPVTRDPFQSLFHSLFGEEWLDRRGALEANRAPLANISETDSAYELAFELPGLAESDINVDVQDNTLTVSAERKDDREERGEGRKWHRVEHRYGRWVRAISLPRDASSDDVDAVYKNGVLTVTVQKAPEAKNRRITVRTAER